MLRFYVPIAMLGGIATLVACSGSKPVADEANATVIPAALQGRWALTPADCTSLRGETKGLLVVFSDNLRFYESQAQPQGELKRTPKSVSGSFAFTGEGMKWKKYQVLELEAGKLVRTESDPMKSFTYARCTS
jgi:hypothetical protein